MIKNRTFLLLAANVLLAVFIVLNLDDEPSSIGNIDGILSEIIANMNEIAIRQPVRGQEIILKKNQMDWFLDSARLLVRRTDSHWQTLFLKSHTWSPLLYVQSTSFE
jgi:hypothetical protein